MNISCPLCHQQVLVPPELAGTLVACPLCPQSFTAPKMALRPFVPSAKTPQPSNELPKVVGEVAVEGVQMPLFEDEHGRRWCTYPQLFRLRQELDDWLFQHGAYIFDHDHFVIHDKASQTCLYIQVGDSDDGRYKLWFLGSRTHWPSHVPMRASRMRSAAEIQQQSVQTLALIGGALLTAALLGPQRKESHIYHHRSY